MLLFNRLFYYLLITEQVGCEIALTTGSVWPAFLSSDLVYSSDIELMG